MSGTSCCAQCTSPAAAAQVVPIPQDLALQLVTFHLGREQQAEDMAEWLAGNAISLLHAGSLSPQGWSALLQQNPALLLSHPRKPRPDDVFAAKWQWPLSSSQLPLAVASLPEAEQLAVVQAALSWWRQQVSGAGSGCLQRCTTTCALLAGSANPATSVQQHRGLQHRTRPAITACTASSSARPMRCRRSSRQPPATWKL